MNFFKIIELFRRLSKIVLLLSLITIPTFWKLAGFTATVTEVNLFLALLATCILSFWFVPSGFSGVLSYFGKVVKKSYDPGIYMIIPFISDIRFMDARTINKKVDDKTMNKDGISVYVTYTIQYTIRPEYAHIFDIEVDGNRHFKNYTGSWVDSALNAILSLLSRVEIMLNREVLIVLLSKVAQDEVDRKSSLVSKKYVPGSTHSIEKIDLDMSEVIEIDDGNGNKENARILKMIPKGYTTTGTREVPDPDDPTKTITVSVPVFMPEQEIVEGESLFEYVKIVINDIHFDDDIQAAMAEKEKKRIAIQATKLEAKRLLEEARGKANARNIETDAEVYNIDKRGRAYTENPSVTKQTVAENFPKVVGSNNPIVDINKLLDDD